MEIQVFNRRSLIDRRSCDSWCATGVERNQNISLLPSRSARERGTASQAPKRRVARGLKKERVHAVALQFERCRGRCQVPPKPKSWPRANWRHLVICSEYCDCKTTACYRMHFAPVSHLCERAGFCLPPCETVYKATAVFLKWSHIVERKSRVYFFNIVQNLEWLNFPWSRLT